MKKVFCITAFLLALAAIILFIFPTVSNSINTKKTQQIIEQYDSINEDIVENKTFEEAVEKGEVDAEGYPIDKDGNRISDTPLLYKPDLDRLYQDSVKYNDNLKVNQYSLLTDSQSYTQPSLDLTDYGIYNGIYGYVSAPTINMQLPIYLGANNTTMSYGAAHLTCTSLPIGGESTNTVLAGHTGYVSSIFFDNLPDLKIGDEVTVTNYWSTLKYKVIKTEICQPTEIQDIFINDEKDLLTMLTCIDSGNKRYIVICERR